nr:hypothetical protein [uncultured Pseudomonas sp.]
MTESFEKGEKLIRAVLDSRLQVIVAVHGFCVERGVSLALAAD